jgi:hypothetical protein
MNWLERDAASVWQPLTQYSRCLDHERTVITRAAEGSWLYDVDGNRILDGASLRAVTVADATPAPTATASVSGATSAPTATASVSGASKEPTLPPPDPDEPSGPSPTDPEGPTDPTPTDPTDPTGPDEPPALDRSRLVVE